MLNPDTRLIAEAYTAPDMFIDTGVNLVGGSGDDYLSTDQSVSWWNEGGEGADYFDFHDGIHRFRIADWEDGIDKIVVQDETTFDSLEIVSNPWADNQTLIKMPDGGWMKLDNTAPHTITIDDFVFRDLEFAPEPEPEALPDILLMFTFGQSLAFGVQDNREVVTTDAIDPERALMLDFETDRFGAVGFGPNDVPVDTFQGFTAMHEIRNETPSSGMVAQFLAEADAAGDEVPTIVHFNVGTGGKSIAQLSGDPYIGHFTEQLQLIKDHADALGLTISSELFGNFIQGQSDANSATYGQDMQNYFDTLDGHAEAILGDDVESQFIVSQTRGVGTKNVALQQFEVAEERDDISFGTSELQQITSLPSSFGSSGHLNAEGYYMLGAHIGDRLYDVYSGNENAPIAMDTVDQTAGNQLVVSFSGIDGVLVDDPSKYQASAGYHAPDNFGFQLYNSNGFTSDAVISDAQISGDAEVTLTFEEDLDGDYLLYLGRTDEYLFTDLDGTVGKKSLGGTTLRSSETGTVVDPTSDWELQDNELYEYAGIQTIEVFA